MCCLASDYCSNSLVCLGHTRQLWLLLLRPPDGAVHHGGLCFVFVRHLSDRACANQTHHHSSVRYIPHSHHIIPCHASNVTGNSSNTAAYDCTPRPLQRSASPFCRGAGWFACLAYVHTYGTQVEKRCDSPLFISHHSSRGGTTAVSQRQILEFEPASVACYYTAALLCRRPAFDRASRVYCCTQ